jgi:MFS family permease
MNKQNLVKRDNRIKTFRWLFYFSLAQLLLFYIIPALVFPLKYVFHIEVIASLTLGLVFIIYFLCVNIIGLLIDRNRKRIYFTAIVLICLWLVWFAISWLFIEHMDYLLR